MDLIKETESLLERCSALSVSAVTENEYPRICILVKVKAEGCKTIYFATGTTTRKVGDYKKNPKAGVTFFEGGDSVTMLGKMSIVENKAQKAALWQEWMTPHFPNGGKNDPGYCILRFDAEEATIYIKNHFETIRV